MNPRVLAVVALFASLCGAAAQPLWAGTSVGMTVAEVLATVPGSALVPEAERAADVFGSEWLVAATGVAMSGLQGRATFGFDDAALRAVMLEFETDLVGPAADLQCSRVMAELSARHGVDTDRDRRTTFGFSLTTATWLDGAVEVALYCFGHPDATTYFVGMRPLSARELDALGAGAE